MIVEDEADTREMLGEGLHTYGASVITAASAAEGLEQLMEHKPDLLVSDIGMPDMDGYDFLLKIRSEFPEESRIPAVALTAYADAEHKDKSLRAGYDAHIAKPVTIADLVSVLAELASRKRL